jgi:hypothetical protein
VGSGDGEDGVETWDAGGGGVAVGGVDEPLRVLRAGGATARGAGGGDEEETAGSTTDAPATTPAPTDSVAAEAEGMVAAIDGAGG